MSTATKTPSGGKARKRIQTNLVINDSLASTATISESDIVNGQHAVGTEGEDYLIYRYSSTQPTITQDPIDSTEYYCYDSFVPDFNLQQSTPSLVGGDRLTIRYRVPSDWEGVRLFIYSNEVGNQRFYYTYPKSIEMSGDSLCVASLLAYKNKPLGESVGLSASYSGNVLLDDYTNPNPTATDVSWYQYMGMTYNEMKVLNNNGDGFLIPSSFSSGFSNWFVYAINGLNLYGIIESLFFGTDPDDPTQDIVNLTFVLPTHDSIGIRVPQYTLFTSSNVGLGAAVPNVVVLSRIPT